MLAALLAVATRLRVLSSVPVRRRAVQDELVCAFDRVHRDRGITAREFCAARCPRRRFATFAVRLVIRWKRTGIEPAVPLARSTIDFEIIRCRAQAGLARHPGPHIFDEDLPAREDELGDWAAALPSQPPVKWAEDGQVYGPPDWQTKLRSKLERHYGASSIPRAPVYAVGPIASSDRLVKDPAVLIPWLQTARKLLAVEMESGGVYRASQERCPMLAIRGISDIVGLKRAEAWTKYACASAAVFTRAFLRTRPVSVGTSVSGPWRPGGAHVGMRVALRRAARRSPPCCAAAAVVGRYWELCLLWALRDALRAGDVWVAGSRRYARLGVSSTSTPSLTVVVTLDSRSASPRSSTPAALPTVTSTLIVPGTASA